MGCRLIVRLLIVVMAVECAASASAGELGEFLSGVARDTKRRNCWPEPFIYPDRQGLRQVMAIQVNAGWERQNQLSEFHFAPGGTDLTEAGRIRAQWIMMEAPEQHRQVFVHRGASPQETAVRMQTVQRYLAQSAYGANIPVLESIRTDDGTPASTVVEIGKKAASAQLDPKIIGGASSGAGH